MCMRITITAAIPNITNTKYITNKYYLDCPNITYFTNIATTKWEREEEGHVRERVIKRDLQDCDCARAQTCFCVRMHACARNLHCLESRFDVFDVGCLM